MDICSAAYSTVLIAKIIRADYYAVLEVPKDMEFPVNVLFEQMLQVVGDRQTGYETLVRALIQVLLVYKRR